MDKYIRFEQSRRQKVDALKQQKSQKKLVKRSLSDLLKTLVETGAVCRLVCMTGDDRVAASIVKPGVQRKVEKAAQDIEQQRRSLQASLNAVNRELQELRSRIAWLESEDYAAKIREAAVAEAKAYVDLVLDSYKQRHEQVHKLLQEELQQLRSKQRITTEDVEELAEDVEEVTKAPPLPPELLQSIPAFRRETLRPVPVSEEEREGEQDIVQALMRELAKRRQVIAEREEEMQ